VEMLTKHPVRNLIGDRVWIVLFTIFWPEMGCGSVTRSTAMLCCSTSPPRSAGRFEVQRTIIRHVTPSADRSSLRDARE
jgi:hypothetical protein